MSRKPLTGLVIAVVVLAFGATSATAHRTFFNTEIVPDRAVVDQDFVEVVGHVTSSRAGCVPARRVVLIARDFDKAGNDSTTAIDVDVTSLRGAFRLAGPWPEGTDEFVVRVLRRNIGRNGHRHICEADTETFLNPL